LKAIGSGDPRDLFAPGLFGLRASVVFAGMQTSPPDDEIDRLELGPYDGLIARIGDLDGIDPPPGWEDRAVARWRARRKRRRLVRLGAVVAAAVLIALAGILA
jgi:hypothetical protein